MDQTQITPDKLKQIRAEHEGWLKNLGTSPGQVKDSYQIVELVDEILRLRRALEPMAKPKTKKEVIVTGGRDYQHDDTVDFILSLLSPERVIQGGAYGADKWAYYWAEENGIPCVTVAADWTKHGYAAGPIRNREMLEKYPDAIVVAFPGGKGTENCIGLATAMGRLVLKVNIWFPMTATIKETL